MELAESHRERIMGSRNDVDLATNDKILHFVQNDNMLLASQFTIGALHG
jgi:hypothetical protein